MDGGEVGVVLRPRAARLPVPATRAPALSFCVRRRRDRPSGVIALKCFRVRDRARENIRLRCVRLWVPSKVP